MEIFPTDSNTEDIGTSSIESISPENTELNVNNDNKYSSFSNNEISTSDSFASDNNDDIQSLSDSKNAIESTPYSDSSNDYDNKTDFRL